MTVSWIREKWNSIIMIIGINGNDNFIIIFWHCNFQVPCILITLSISKFNDVILLVETVNGE